MFSNITCSIMNLSVVVTAADVEGFAVEDDVITDVQVLPQPVLSWRWEDDYYILNCTVFNTTVMSGNGGGAALCATHYGNTTPNCLIICNHLKLS